MTKGITQLAGGLSPSGVPLAQGRGFAGAEQCRKIQEKREIGSSDE